MSSNRINIRQIRRVGKCRFAKLTENEKIFANYTQKIVNFGTAGRQIPKNRQFWYAGGQIETFSAEARARALKKIIKNSTGTGNNFLISENGGGGHFSKPPKKISGGGGTPPISGPRVLVCTTDQITFYLLLGAVYS